MTPKTYQEIEAILREVAFPDRRFLLHVKGDGFLLQVTYMEADVETGVVEEQRARKWYISPFSTETEIVETALLAIQRSMMHVVGEHFTYRGRRVYSPHFHIENRVELCDLGAFDQRPPPVDPEAL
jgi:hypothetical protein